MTNKRKHPEKQDVGSPLFKKRSRLHNLDGSDDSPTSSQSRIDPTYGQRGAFPGLDDTRGDDELFYGPASDGLEYLRMVRSEAKTVPNLLVAPTSPSVHAKESNLYTDYPQGYYSDGAYTAIPPPPSNPNQAYANSGQQDDKDPQEAYYASLCARFAELTRRLQTPPSRTAPDNTDLYYFGRRLWWGKILSTTPTMISLAQLTQESVICGLDVLGSLLTLANLRGRRGKNIGAWTWGLLGKCREVGQMGSEEVGVLRKLGKQAAWLLRRIGAGEVIGEAADEPDIELGEEEEEEVEREGEDEDECVEDSAELLDAVDVDDGDHPHIDSMATAALGHDGNSEINPVVTVSDADLAKAKQNMIDSLNDNQAHIDSIETGASNEDSVQQHTSNHPVTEARVDSEEGPIERADEKALIHATLDMLVTIIGEFYGQRDLLDGRLLWDEMQ